MRRDTRAGDRRCVHGPCQCARSGAHRSRGRAARYGTARRPAARAKFSTMC